MPQRAGRVCIGPISPEITPHRTRVPTRAVQRPCGGLDRLDLDFCTLERDFRVEVGNANVRAGCFAL